MKKLISDLVGPAYNGKPILVIGGGPSAAVALKNIPLDFPACVISANQHGFMQDRFKVDFIVSVDFTFGNGRVPMQEFMAKYNTPHINRWSWADYRIPEWNFNGDSGMTAVTVAVMLGGHPVIAVGLDRYVGAKRYFWHETCDPNWRKPAVNVDNLRVHTEKCIDFCRGSAVRLGAPGPMQYYWPLFKPDEFLPQWAQCGAPQCHLKGRLYSQLGPVFLHPTDRVGDGPVLLTDSEARGFLNIRKVVLL